MDALAESVKDLGYCHFHTDRSFTFRGKPQNKSIVLELASQHLDGYLEGLGSDLRTTDFFLG